MNNKILQMLTVQAIVDEFDILHAMCYAYQAFRLLAQKDLFKNYVHE